MAKIYESMTVGKAYKMVNDTLCSRGIPTAGKEQAIITAAGDLAAYCRSLADIDKLPQTYYETKTREGNLEFRTYPAVKNLPALSKSVRESMAALGVSFEAVIGEVPGFADVQTR